MYAEDNPNSKATVRIKHPDFSEGLLINEDEFDENEHELFDADSGTKKRSSRKKVEEAETTE